jgi:hypothetical protein
MRRLMGMLAMVVVLVALPSLSQEQTLCLILKDHSVVMGALVGVNAGVLSMRNANGMAVVVAMSDVEEAFDADTSDGVSLDSPAGAKPAVARAGEDGLDKGTLAPVIGAQPAAMAARSAEDEKMAEARRCRSNKAKSETLSWTGASAGLLGIVVMCVGALEMNDAMSTSYPHENPDAGAKYEINGKWYTADQNNAYYEGQTRVIVGGVVTLAGLTASIIGACIAPHRNPDGAMLHIEDGQMAMALPSVDWTQSGEMRTTLVGARF